MPVWIGAKRNLAKMGLTHFLIVFLDAGIVGALVVFVIIFSIFCFLRRPRSTSIDNLLMSSGSNSLNSTGSTQLPLMDNYQSDNTSTLDKEDDASTNSEYLSRAVVKYRFEANDDYKDQMSVEKDDQLLVKEKYEDGWWLVQKEATGEEGIVPGSYCHDIRANRRPSEPFIGAHGPSH